MGLEKEYPGMKRGKNETNTSSFDPENFRQRSPFDPQVSEVSKERPTTFLKQKNIYAESLMTKRNNFL